MLCKAQKEFIIFANMKYTLRVINDRQGRLLTKYINYILKRAFDLTDEDYNANQKFKQYCRIIKGIIIQANTYTERPGEEKIDMLRETLIAEWMYMTPNLMFHSFNGFLAGLGQSKDMCDEELMEKTFTTIKGLSDIASNMEDEYTTPIKFKDYVRD